MKKKWLIFPNRKKRNKKDPTYRQNIYITKNLINYLKITLALTFKNDEIKSEFQLK